MTDNKKLAITILESTAKFLRFCGMPMTANDLLYCKELLEGVGDV